MAKKQPTPAQTLVEHQGGDNDGMDFKRNNLAVVHENAKIRNKSGIKVKRRCTCRDGTKI